ncbi:MFS transporter [Clostridia bacterium]|nr:MFS transporter [Clostridia bacterium]
MRRRDREVTNLNDILDILKKCQVLRIALCSNNKPYILPMNFAFEVKNGEIFIYMHCAKQGKKIDIISKNSSVCFEADVLHEVVKTEKPSDWTAEYESVIGEGDISMISNETEKIAALELLMLHYGFNGKPIFEAKILKSVAILQIKVSAITGKRNLK